MAKNIDAGNQQKGKLLAEIIIVLAILGVAAILRLSNNSTEPGYYNDEGTLINIAQNIDLGRMEYLGIQDGFLIAARQPLFVWILALLFKMFGTGITVLRTFTGTLGVLNVLLVYLILRKKDKPLAFLASLWFATFPEAVLYSRIGFSYNLEVTLVLLAFWAALIYLERGSRVFVSLCAFSLGMAFLTELAALAFLPVLIVLVLWKRWKDIFLSLGLYLIPFTVYSAAMLIKAPEAYLFDFNFIFFRVSSLAAYLRISLFVINIAKLTGSLFLLFGFIGLFFCRDDRLKKLLALFTFIPLVIIGTSRGVDGLSEHQLICLFPFICIGLAAITLKVIESIQSFSSSFAKGLLDKVGRAGHLKALRNIQGITAGLLILTFVLIPMAKSPLTDLYDLFNGGYRTPLDAYLIDPSEGKAVADFINRSTAKGEVILASPAIAWMMKGNVTDYVISMAFDGTETNFFPVDFPRGRMAFDPSSTKVSYMVVDNIWRNWGEEYVPELVTLRQTAEKGRVVYQTEHITVYRMK